MRAVFFTTDPPAPPFPASVYHQLGFLSILPIGPSLPLSSTRHASTISPSPTLIRTSSTSPPCCPARWLYSEGDGSARSTWIATAVASGPWGRAERRGWLAREKRLKDRRAKWTREGAARKGTAGRLGVGSVGA